MNLLRDLLNGSKNSPPPLPFYPLLIKPLCIFLSFPPHIYPFKIPQYTFPYHPPLVETPFFLFCSHIPSLFALPLSLSYDSKSALDVKGEIKRKRGGIEKGVRFLPPRKRDGTKTGTSKNFWKIGNFILVRCYTLKSEHYNRGKISQITHFWKYKLFSYHKIIL